MSEPFVQAGKRSTYPAYKPSSMEWLGDIPEHWEVKRAKALLVRNDGGVWGEDPDNDGVIVLRSTEQTVDGAWSIVEPAKRRLTATEFAASRLMEGDLVVTKSSGSSLHIGKTSIVTKDVEALDCCYSNFMQRLRVKQNTAPGYLWYVLNGEVGRKQFDYYSRTTTGLANLNAAIIGNVRMAVPSEVEQRSIAAFLDRETARIDDLIAKKRRQIELLQEKRTALISHAVTKGLDPNVKLKDSGVVWLGKVPSHWQAERLQYRCNISGGLSPHESTYNDWGDGDVLINGPAEYSETDYGLTRALKWTTDPKRWAPKGSLLFCLRGATTGRLNVTHDKVAIGRGVASLIAQDSQAYLDFVMVVLRPLILGTANGSTYPSVTTETLGDWRPHWPPSGEQQAIAAFLDRETARIDGLIAKVNGSIEKLQEYRSALITAAVTGKIDVRKGDSND